MARWIEPATWRGRPGWVRGWAIARSALTIAFVWLCLTWPNLGRAELDRPPADVVAPTNNSITLPKVPRGFVEDHVGQVTWAYDPSATSLAHDLSTAAPAMWRTITAELGVRVPMDLTIRIARGPRDMIALAPRGAPPPSYAVGVAYPALGLIILSVVEPSRWLPPDLQSVLTHELSHVALYRAAHGQPLPLWFVEGLAVHQAREQNLSRIQTLWEASVAGGLLPLSALSRNFPSTPHAVNLAYAQSADLVNHMLRDADDREALSDLITRVAGGATFERALLASYRIDLPYLDREWRQSLRERFHLTPLVLTGSVIWGGIAILAVLAFMRRRRQHREKLARWGEEEALHERAIAALELQRRTAEREEQMARAAAAMPELGREPGVPTVEHDGQQYTLH